MRWSNGKWRSASHLLVGDDDGRDAGKEAERPFKCRPDLNEEGLAGISKLAAQRPDEFRPALEVFRPDPGDGQE